MLMGKHKEALQAFTAAMEQDPKSYDNYYNRALVHRNMKNYSNSLSDYELFLKHAETGTTPKKERRKERKKEEKESEEGNC